LVAWRRSGGDEDADDDEDEDAGALKRTRTRALKRTTKRRKKY